jgi:hypothetical protein
MNPYGDLYYDHFEEFFGHPMNRRIFKQGEHQSAIQILEYDGVFKGCRVLCSLGLSHYIEEVGGIYEVYLPVDDGWDSAPTILANTLFACIQQSLPLGRGACMGGIENVSPDFARAFEKAAIYFTYPYGLPPAFGRISYEDSIGLVLLGMFISSREREFFLDRGAEEFESLIESQEVDPVHLRRRSAV